jgi:hypothetical protein
MFTEGVTLKNRVAKMAKKSAVIATGAAIAAAYVPMVPIMFITMSGSIKSRAGQAIIWPALMVTYSLDSETKLGTFTNKKLLEMNRKYDNVMRNP